MRTSAMTHAGARPASRVSEHQQGPESSAGLTAVFKFAWEVGEGGERGGGREEPATGVQARVKADTLVWE